MNKSKAICGWHNTITGESGKFDKDMKPIKYTFWDKIKLWWMLKKTKSIQPPSSFVFSDTVKMNKLYNGQFMGEKILTIYVNHALELARTQSGEYIDYNAWQKKKQISYIDNEKI